MNLKRITDRCKHNAAGYRTQLPSVGAFHFPTRPIQLEVFEDERDGLIYLFARHEHPRVIQIETFIPNKETRGRFMVDAHLYDKFVSEYEHQNGISLERMQSMIWVMAQMARADKQHGPEGGSK